MTAGGVSPARPTDRLLIRGARQIVTLQGPARMRQRAELRSVGLLRDASILIEGGRIVEVGSARRLDNLKDAATARVLDARHLVIVPGLLDAAHDLLPLSTEGESEGPTSAATETPREEPLEPAPFYDAHTLHTVVRGLERELGKLSWAGTAFTQFRLRFPRQLGLQSRLLRNLLQLDAPMSGFRAELHFHRLPDLEAGSQLPYWQHLSTAARGYWKRMEPSLAVSVHSAALRHLSVQDRLHALRQLGGGLPCFLTSPEALDPEALLGACGGSGGAVIGSPPERAEVREAAARLDIPWIVPGGETSLGCGPLDHTLRAAIDSGMWLALSSGYDVNRPGCVSPFALASRLRQEGKLEPEEILQLSVVNLAYALGLGNRLGSIQAGRDANLTILECEDYREIGMHLGLPPILASFRRGVVMERRLSMRG